MSCHNCPEAGKAGQGRFSCAVCDEKPDAPRVSPRARFALWRALFDEFFGAGSPARDRYDS